MQILKEFKEFAIKGNMFDMAIGIIIGSGFKIRELSLQKRKLYQEFLMINLFLTKKSLYLFYYLQQYIIVNF